MLACATVLALLPVSEIPELAMLSNALNASSAETTMNASKAIGINNDAALEGFDEDDDKTDPYGKQTVVFGNADEVYGSTMGKAEPTSSVTARSICAITHCSRNTCSGVSEYIS